MPDSYSPSEVPNTTSFGYSNTFDTTGLSGRTVSHHWDSRQYAALPAAFKTSLDFSALSASDYFKAHRKHWLLYGLVTVVSDVLSMEVRPAPMGLTRDRRSGMTTKGKRINSTTRIPPTKAQKSSPFTSPWFCPVPGKAAGSALSAIR